MNAETDETAGQEAEYKTWEAAIQRDSDGDPLGAPLYLTAAELRELGADLDACDNKLVCWVKDGHLGFG